MSSAAIDRKKAKHPASNAKKTSWSRVRTLRAKNATKIATPQRVVNISIPPAPDMVSMKERRTPTVKATLQVVAKVVSSTRITIGTSSIMNPGFGQIS